VFSARERERKVRIKLKWKKIWSLPKGSKVVVNADTKQFPRGTRLEITGWWGWKIALKGMNKKYRQHYFSSRDIDAYDIVRAADFCSLTAATAVDTLRIHDGNGTKTDTSRARVESTKTGRRGGGGPEFDRAPGEGRDRNSGIAGATDPDYRGGIS
jgi:hypothetical protein